MRRIAEEAEASARCRAAEEEVRDRRIAEIAAAERLRAAKMADEERPSNLVVICGQIPLLNIIYKESNCA